MRVLSNHKRSPRFGEKIVSLSVFSPVLRPVGSRLSEHGASPLTCQSSSTTEIARRPERLSERKPAFYEAEPRAPSTMTDKRYTGDGIYCRGHNSSETVRVSARQMGLIQLPVVVSASSVCTDVFRSETFIHSAFRFRGGTDLDSLSSE